jgi:hypothetical protein
MTEEREKDLQNIINRAEKQDIKAIEKRSCLLKGDH